MANAHPGGSPGGRQICGYHVAGGTTRRLLTGVIAPGGTQVSVAHDLRQVAGRPAGREVQRRERVAHRLRTEVPGQVVRQTGLRGEAPHHPPYVGGEQPSPVPVANSTRRPEPGGLGRPVGSVRSGRPVR